MCPISNQKQDILFTYLSPSPKLTSLIAQLVITHAKYLVYVLFSLKKKNVKSVDLNVVFATILKKWTAKIA